MKVVVDASVAIKWYAPEIYEAEATRLLEGSYELNAPELIIPEFASIVWQKERRGEFGTTLAIAQNIVKAFYSANVLFHPQVRVAIAAFVGARMTAQTVYDWTYLALALSLSCRLVTADEKFYKALEKTSMRKHLLWVGDVV